MKAETDFGPRESFELNSLLLNSLPGSQLVAALKHQGPTLESPLLVADNRIVLRVSGETLPLALLGVRSKKDSG